MAGRPWVAERSAGRAARGRLLLETATPDHHVIQALTRGDYHYFAARELAARRETGSPPFRRLVRVSSPVAPDADLMAALGALPGTVALGPVPTGGSTAGMEVRLKVDARVAPAGVVRELAALVKDFPGEAPVYVDLVTSVGSKLLELGANYRVHPVPDFFAEVRHLLGEAAVA